MDFDPENMTQYARVLCTENRSKFEPNLDIQPILHEYEIPAEYSV